MFAFITKNIFKNETKSQPLGQLVQNTSRNKIVGKSVS